MTEVGTDSGILVHETIATDGDEAATTTNEAESEDTHEIGTACGLDHVLGIVIVAGAVTKLERATVIIAVLGIEAIALIGTLFGTLVHATITADGDE
jgi:hypothetical protein